MPKWTQSILGSLPAAIVIEVVVQGILQSIPFDNAPIIDGTNYILPIGAALLPWILYGISVFYALVILNYARKWFIDRHEGGPKKRAFHALYSDIIRCKNQLIEFDKRLILYRIEQTSTLANLISIVSRLDKIRVALCKMNIDIPTLDLNVSEHRQSMVGFLSFLEEYASSGDVDRARIAVRGFQQQIDQVKVDR